MAGIFLDDAASGHVICGCWVTQSLPPPVVMCAFLPGDGCRGVDVVAAQTWQVSFQPAVLLLMVQPEKKEYIMKLKYFSCQLVSDVFLT